MSNNNNFNLFGLFRSKIRTRLLVNFFINPEKEYYVRGLERDLKTPASMIQRELKKLEDGRIISSRKIGNIILYKIDKTGPFYREIRELTLVIAGIDKLIMPVFAKEKNIIVCFIYGSYARGDFEATSDIDIFVLVNDKEGLYERISSGLLKYEEMLGREFNMSYFSRQELRNRLKRKDPFMADVLKNSKIFVKGGKNDLRFSDGQKATGKLYSNQ